MTDEVDAELWIPTKNSEKTLHATIASVRTLDPKPKKIRIIDGGSTDDTEAIADYFDVEIVDQGDARGLAGARNVALEETTTTYIAFVDDDVQPQPSWLGCLIDELEGTGAGAATAPIRHYPTTIAERWGVRRLRFNLPHDGRDTHRIPGANGCYRVSSLRSIDGWDEVNTPFGGEDVSLSRRLRRSHGLRYVPDTGVLHVPAGGIEPILKLWHWHTQNGPPDDRLSLLIRTAEHVAKSGKYAYQDLREGNAEFLFFDFAVAPLHIYFDYSGYLKSR